MKIKLDAQGHTNSSPPARYGWLQRTCQCGQQANGGECLACRKKNERSLQRHASDREKSLTVPPEVSEVLQSPGRPLDPITRTWAESRFDHEFSRVRVHADTRAADSARAVHALAYTAGSHIVFGTGRYSPATHEGRSLLAHELTHVVQQSGLPEPSTSALAIDPSPEAEREAAHAATQEASTLQVQSATTASLQRAACLPITECATPGGQSAQTRAALTDPAYVQRRQAREQHCHARPPDPACTGDGHAARATNMETLLANYGPDRLSLVHGIFVDRDIPSSWGAYRGRCDAFVPSIDGADSCIFVPYDTEQEAARYRAGDAKINGMQRDEWSLLNLRILMHETGHARFEAVSHPTPGTGECTFEQIRAELHEIAADMDDFETVYDLLQSRRTAPAEQRTRLNDLFKTRWVPRAESNWKQVRCVCSCNAAEAHLRHTVSTMTVHWPLSLEVIFHTALQSGIPSWPIAPPQPWGPGDYPLPGGDRRAA